MRILDIYTSDVANGPGCRVTVWIAGCSHRCPGCHNQHTWDYNQGEPLEEDTFLIIEEQLAREEIEGITFTGGDPLSQDIDTLYELASLMHWVKTQTGKSVWVYSGATYEDLINEEDEERKKAYLTILAIADVLVDGKFVKELYDPTLAFRGSSNQRIIDLQATAAANGLLVLKEIE